MEPSHYTKSGQPALEELTGEYEPSNSVSACEKASQTTTCWNSRDLPGILISGLDKLTFLLYLLISFFSFITFFLCHRTFSLFPRIVNKSLTFISSRFKTGLVSFI
jgi:hypothetical protein